MKILLVGSPFTDFMGEFGLIFKVAKGLKNLGHEVSIVTTDADCFYYDKQKSISYSSIRKKFLKSNLNPIIYKEIPVYALHCNIHRLGLYCKDAKKFANEIIPKYDVVHIATWYNYICMIFAKISHEQRIPFIVSSWGSLLPNARKLKGIQKWAIDQIYTKKIIKHATGFQSVGESETKEYMRLGAAINSIYRLDNPVELEKFVIKNKTDILKKNHIQDSKYLLFLGRINEKKGIEMLLEAFVSISKRQDKLLLVIAGSGTKQYEKQIKDLVKKLELQNKVIFTGLISDDEKLEILGSATLFILTSHSDVHPIAVQDALAMGLPVVITHACDYPEVEEYNAGIIVEENINQISSKILEILSDESRLINMSKNAKTLVHEKFQLETQVKKYEQMYVDVIRRQRTITENN